MSIPEPPPPSDSSHRSMWIGLAIVLLLAFLLRLNQLGHAGVKDLDEVFHAIVARGLIDHPLTPTLYATPYLDYDYRNWQANHVWLHKPPVALWQMAVSMHGLGESNFALRVPSLLLSTAAVGLTFLIGRALGDPRAGLVAAGLQALSPAITRLVHGEVFSDHVDVAMLFYCELATLLLLAAARTGRLRDAALVGVVQALAWLTKSHPALYVTGLAFLLVLARRWDGGGQRFHLSWRQVLALVAATLLTSLPWVVWCLIHFPREFRHEQFHVLSHLYTNVELFAAPWDRLLFDYLLRGLLEWYPLAMAGIVLTSIDGIRLRDCRRLFLVAWALGVLVPHLLATTKTPTATLIGWPAAWVAIGLVVSDAMRGRAAALGATLVAALMIAFWRQLPRSAAMGYGPDYIIGRVALDAWPVIVQAAVILLAAAVAAYWLRSRLVAARTRTILIVLVLAWPITNHARLAWQTTQAVPTDPVAFAKLGRAVRDQAPANAVFLVDNRARNEHLLAMWWLDRTCYPLLAERFDADVRTILDRGGIPFVLSRGEWSGGRVLMNVPGEGTIYRLD